MRFPNSALDVVTNMINKLEAADDSVARAIWEVDDHPARKSWEAALADPDYDDAIKDCRKYAAAAIAALRADGWVKLGADEVVVPKEPSEAMIEDARMTLPGPVDICDADIEDIYLTMLAAAPATGGKEG